MDRGWARAFALGIAGVAWGSLVLQYLWVDTLPGTDRPLVILGVMAAFFTVVSNVLVAVTMTAVGIAGRPMAAWWHGGLLAWILETGIVFHLLLAGFAPTGGAGGLAAAGLHTGVPLLVLAHWLLLAPKALAWRHALWWLLLPGAYAAAALVGTHLTGRAIYPFLDVAALGWGGVGLRVAVMAAAFLALHVGIVAAARVMRGRAPSGGPAPSGPRPR